MNKSIKYLGLIVSLLLLTIGLLGTQAFATEGDSTTSVMEIPVEVLVEGELPEEPEIFKVSLTAEQDNAPMPQETVDGVYTMKIQGGTKASIVIPCTKMGVYNYKIQMVPGENVNCIYSADVYHVTLFILNGENGGYDISAVAYKNDGEEKSEIRFVNRYVNSDTVSVEAVKLLDGKTPGDGAFTFTLRDNGGKVVAEAKNLGQKVLFPEIRCYEEGTFRYTVREVKGTAPAIVYDTTVYDVVIDVTRDQEKNYVATVRYEKDGKEIQGLPVFKNVTINPDVPHTGDENDMQFFLILMIGAAVGVVALLSYLILTKKNKEEDQI